MGIGKILRFLIVLAAVPAAVFLYGLSQLGKGDDDAAKTAHRDAKYQECLAGSDAAPDKLYCEQMADLTIAYVTNWGFVQTVLNAGSKGIIPAWYHTPTPREEMRARREAEYLAQSQGADGSTRFTGSRLAEVEAELAVLEEEWEKEIGIHEQAEQMRQQQEALQN